MSDNRPIGIFDSGVGGLTVLAELRRRLPKEDFVYLGDTARLPYGTKSRETAIRYSLRAGLFLLDQDIKLLVVACNTASAAALPELENALTVPVVGVVKPGAYAAARRFGIGIGVIGTESTIASRAYERAIREIHSDVHITSRACPLFVPLAEEGWFDHPVTHQVAKIYLDPMLAEGIDTLILGCTHYPLLRGAIANAVGPEVALVDSASSVADAVEDTLVRKNMQTQSGRSHLRLMVTDAASRFSRIVGLILPNETPQFELVDLPHSATH